jgi:hypothetical protein
MFQNEFFSNDGLAGWYVLEIVDEMSHVTVQHFDPISGMQYQELNDND